MLKKIQVKAFFIFSTTKKKLPKFSVQVRKLPRIVSARIFIQDFSHFFLLSKIFVLKIK